jgi:hypothetical protein
MGFLELKTWLAKRMPTSQQLVPVYGVIVLIVYGWTIYWYLWKLPSWLYFLTLGEMAVAFAYAMVVNFLESILVLIVPVLLCLLLPSRWFRDQFVAQGTALVICSLAALIKYLGVIITLQAIPAEMGVSALLVIVGIVSVVFLVGRIGFLRNMVSEIANRTTIFLYVFLPISAISILVVVGRNLFEALNG